MSLKLSLFYKRQLILFLLFFIPWGLNAQDKQLQGISSEAQEQLQALKNMEEGLNQKRGMVAEILQEVEDVENIVNSVNYEDSKALIDTLAQFIERIETNPNPESQAGQMLELYRLINTANRANQETFAPVFTKLRKLKKYATLTNPTAAQEFRDAQLQLMRLGIMAKVTGQYYVKSMDIPEFVFLDGGENIQIARTVQYADSLSYYFNSGFIRRLEERAGRDDFESLKSIFNNSIQEFRQTIAEETKKIESEITSAKDEYSRQLAIAQQNQADIDKKLIWFGLPLFGLFVIFVFLIPRVYRTIGMQSKLVDSGLLMELSTVFLLVAAIIILGIGNKIDSNVLGTLLSGIAGYVLGKNSQIGKNNQQTPPEVKCCQTEIIQETKDALTEEELDRDNDDSSQQEEGEKEGAD